MGGQWKKCVSNRWVWENGVSNRGVLEIGLEFKGQWNWSHQNMKGGSDFWVDYYDYTHYMKHNNCWPPWVMSNEFSKFIVIYTLQIVGGVLQHNRSPRAISTTTTTTKYILKTFSMIMHELADLNQKVSNDLLIAHKCNTLRNGEITIFGL